MLEYEPELESEIEAEHGAEIAPEPFEEYVEDSHDNYQNELVAEPIDDYVRARYQDSEASDTEEALRRREFKLKFYYRRTPNVNILVDLSNFNEISAEVKKLLPYENSVKIDSVKLKKDNSVVIKIYDTDTYYKHTIYKKFITLNNQDCMVEFEEDI